MSPSLARCSFLLALPLAACILVVDGDGVSGFSWGHSTRGSGVRAEEDRALAEFRAIELETDADVVVRVGEAPGIHLSGDDDLLPRVVTRVEDGTLSIALPGSCSFRCGLELVIGTPTLERFTIAGSGDVRIQGLAAEHVELAIEGSGSLRAEGSAHSVSGSIEGSGSLSLAELAAESAELSIDGSGSMEVLVAQTLRYSIAGSGSIQYAGSPELDGHIDGSGSVERRR